MSLIGVCRGWARWGSHQIVFTLAAPSTTGEGKKASASQPIYMMTRHAQLRSNSMLRFASASQPIYMRTRHAQLRSNSMLRFGPCLVRLVVVARAYVAAQGPCVFVIPPDPPLCSYWGLRGFRGATDRARYNIHPTYTQYALMIEAIAFRLVLLPFSSTRYWTPLTHTVRYLTCRSTGRPLV